jgi:hypothetical protein
MDKGRLLCASWRGALLASAALLPVSAAWAEEQQTPLPAQDAEPGQPAA